MALNQTDPPAANVRRRWPWVAGGVVLALLVAIGIGEATGWPFLVEPLQRWLSQTLDRRIAAGKEGGDGERVRIGLIGSIRVQAPTIEIGSPAWSKAPHMILAHDALLKLGYADLWHAAHGGELRIRELRAERLDMQLERLADGRASWQFGPPKPPDPEHVARLPSFGELRVGDGALLFRDAVLEADLEARFSLTERSRTRRRPCPPARRPRSRRPARARRRARRWLQAVSMLRACSSTRPASTASSR